MNIRPCLLSAVLVVPQSGLGQASEDSFPRPHHTPSGSVSRIETPFKLYDDYLIVLWELLTD